MAVGRGAARRAVPETEVRVGLSQGGETGGEAMTRGIRGVLFDKDGTLLDFEATWRGFAQEMLAELAPGDAGLQARLGDLIGLDPGTGRFRPGSPIVAGSTAEVAALLAPHLPGWEAAALEREANARAAEAMARGPAPAADDLPGLLEGLRGRGLALGIATHDAEASARAHMRALGAEAAFGFVAGYDSGHGLKPGPGMVEAFARAAGLACAEVAMVGDSLHDLHAGRAAGAGLVVGVLTGPAERAELDPHADLVLGSIAELPEALAGG